MITEKPEGIILTIPQRFFVEYGMDRFIRVMVMIDKGTIQSWGNTISSIPKHEVLYCYFLYNKQIRLRMNIVGYQKNQYRAYEDTGIVREFNNKNWVDLTGPVVWAPEIIPMKGFQGFRYTKKLF